MGLRKRNELGFVERVGYPHDWGIVEAGIELEREIFGAICTQLEIKPENKVAEYGWCDRWCEKGYYLYQHDDSFALLTIPMGKQEYL